MVRYRLNSMQIAGNCILQNEHRGQSRIEYILITLLRHTICSFSKAMAKTSHMSGDNHSHVTQFLIQDGLGGL